MIIYLGQQIPANGSESGPFVATFDAQGGSPTPPTQSVVAGQHLTAPASPTRDGYNFVGWTKNLVTQEIFNFSTETLTSDITLYAVWQSTTTNNPGGYYNSITATSGVELVNQLNTLIKVVKAGNGSQNTSYDEVITLLQTADKATSDPSKLWGIYDGAFLPIPWDHINNWNREHVWPQSLLGENASPSARNMATDAHNLRACTPSVNSSRSNKYFDLTTGSYTYFPGNEHKGDVARILLYMALRYKDTLSLVDGAPSTGQMSRISLLKQWHLEDPVDQFEIQRNQAIYEKQGNRNPFIDNEQWFNSIWSYFMEQAGLQAKATQQFNATIITYDILKTTYTPTQTRYTI